MNSREMIRGRMMARVALMLGTWLAVSGSYSSCSFNSGSGPDDEPPPASGTFTSSLTLRNVSGVETTSFVFGEPVRFDFEIVNRTDRQQRLQFPNTQTHDFLVVDHRSVRIRWQWSFAQDFARESTELVFEPFASKTFTVYWPGTLADGTQLPVGAYQARGAVIFDGFDVNPLAASELGSELVTFEVR